MPAVPTFSDRAPTVSASLPVANVAPFVVSPMSARSSCSTPEPSFQAWQSRDAPQFPNYRAPVFPEPALPVALEDVSNERCDGPLDPNEVRCPNVYSNAEHRHLDTL